MFDLNAPKVVERANMVPNATCVIDGVVYDVRNLLHRIQELEAEVEFKDSSLGDYMVSYSTAMTKVEELESELSNFKAQHNVQSVTIDEDLKDISKRERFNGKEK